MTTMSGSDGASAGGSGGWGWFTPTSDAAPAEGPAPGALDATPPPQGARTAAAEPEPDAAPDAASDAAAAASGTVPAPAAEPATDDSS